MEHRLFGPTRREIGVVGQGTWNVERDDSDGVIAALHRGLDLGMDHIDTAELYGDGLVEELVGEAIEDRRDEVFLVSKVMPENATRSETIEACERSLLYLRTDYLDCYLLHWRDEDVPLEETIEAFERLQRAGKIRSWGVSNFDVEDLEDAYALVGPGKIACNQVLYHLQERAIEHAVLPWCEAHGVTVTAYSPFGHDRFPGRRSPGGQVLQDIARAHGATPRQVALRFLVRNPAVVTIPKSSSPAHTAENAGAGDLQLTDAEIAEIDAAFPAGPPKRGLPML
jgi:diketogulonate reductase-like aldo/keto reductase